MRIVIGTDNYYPVVNGVSYFTQRLAEDLVKRGHEVLVIAPSLHFKYEYRTHNGVRIFGIRSMPVFFYKGFRFSPPGFLTRRIAREIKNFKPDVVHIQSHFFISRTTGEAAKLLRIPVVGTNHFMPENFLFYVPFSSAIESEFKHFAWWQFRRFFQKLSAVTTPTQSAATVLKENGFTKPVQVISCGIDRERFQPGPKNQDLIKKYKLPTNRPTFLFVGRIDRDKSLDLLIKAVAQARKKADFQLVLAGKGIAEKFLKDLAQEFGISEFVTFTGYIPDSELADLYRSVDGFVIASCVELQSIVTLEAISTGLPVIAARAVALPELAQDGRNGYLFTPKNKAQLADRLIKLANYPELRKTFGQESLKIAETHDIKKTIGEFETLYQKVSKTTSQPR